MDLSYIRSVESVIHTVPTSVGLISHAEYDVDLSDFFSAALDYLLSSEVKADLVRGDIVHFESMGNYRNDGKCIYDGTDLQNLDRDDDDEGSVPDDFPVIKEFPVGYWLNTIFYN